jgi:hypothetical protein
MRYRRRRRVREHPPVMSTLISQAPDDWSPGLRNELLYRAALKAETPEAHPLLLGLMKLAYSQGAYHDDREPTEETGANP